MKLSEILQEQSDEIEWPENPELGVGTENGWIAFYCWGEDEYRKEYLFDPKNFWFSVGYSDYNVGLTETKKIDNYMQGSNLVSNVYRSLNDDLIYIGSDTSSVLPDAPMTVCIAFERTQEKLKQAILKFAQSGEIKNMSPDASLRYTQNPAEIFNSKYLIMFPTKLNWDL